MAGLAGVLGRAGGKGFTGWGQNLVSQVEDTREDLGSCWVTSG